MKKRRTPETIERLAKRFFPPRSSLRVHKIEGELKRGYHPGLGFLHIPKTGGSGIDRLGRNLVRAGQPFLCYFEHGWPFAKVRPSRVLAKYGDGDIARMRARLAAEYAIYDALVALGREPRIAGTAAA